MKFSSNFSAPFIRRPVATSLLTIAIFLSGAVAFRYLPVAPLPQVDFPTIAVGAGLPGASPTTRSRCCRRNRLLHPRGHAPRRSPCANSRRGARSRTRCRRRRGAIGGGRRVVAIRRRRPRRRRRQAPVCLSERTGRRRDATSPRPSRHRTCRRIQPPSREGRRTRLRAEPASAATG